MSLALLLPGQGAQHAGMLPWLDTQPEAQPALMALAAQLGNDWRGSLDDPAWLHANAVAQPLLTGIALAACPRPPSWPATASANWRPAPWPECSTRPRHWPWPLRARRP